jgi:hypothetical protein
VIFKFDFQKGKTMSEISVDDLSIEELMQLTKRTISPADQKKFEGYMPRFLPPWEWT